MLDKLKGFDQWLLKANWKKIGLRLVQGIAIALPLAAVAYFGGLGIVKLAGWIIHVPSYLWNAGFWPDPKGELMMKMFSNHSSWAGAFLSIVKSVSLLFVTTAILILAINLWPTKKVKPATDDKGDAAPKDGDKIDSSLKLQSGRSWLWFPFVTVPEQYTVWIYSYFFGIGKVRRVRDKTSWKIPLFQVAFLKSCREIGVTITTPQLPVRSTPSVKAGQFSGERESEETRLRIQAERGGSVIGATLSFTFPMIVGLRSADGQRSLIKANPAFSNISSDEVKTRFTSFVSTRLRDVLKRMRFEDAYMLDGRVFFIGTVDEATGDETIEGHRAVGPERYARLLASTDSDYTIPNPIDPRLQPINIFSIDLADDRQVAAAVAKRPESLLATFWNFGYRVPFMKAEDPNATDDVQKALQDRVMAELQRDAEATRQLSKIVDKARAEIDARGAHARATRDNFRMVMSAILEEPPKDLAENERQNYIARKLRELFTPKQLLDAQMFYEIWRRKVQVAENAEQFTYIDAGGSEQANFMAAMAAGAGAAQKGPFSPADTPKEGPEKGTKK